MRHAKVNILSPLLALALFMPAQSVSAQETLAMALNVATNGVDSPTCGAMDDPCRSINQAIANAIDGDRIVVGPGRYGPVEEMPADPSCECMILVDKAVQLESLSGAEATVLDAEVAAMRTVQIRADGIVFGGEGKGFTITGADFGLMIEEGTSNIQAIGNVVSNNLQHGFLVFGSGHTFTKNVASDNGNRGFFVRNSGHEIRRNAVLGNQNFGIEVNSSDVTITENTIFGNGTNGSNCGLVNVSGSLLLAPNNFWGAASGPGPDPADLACGSLQGGPIDVTPFATQAFDIASRQTEVTFEEIETAGPLQGIFGGIDWGWGDGQWFLDDLPCGACQPQLAYMGCEPEGCRAWKCRDFTFVEPSVLEAFTSSAKVEGQLDIRSFDASGSMLGELTAQLTAACALYETGWTQLATRVEVCYQFGSALAFDNVMYRTPATP